MLRLEYTHQLLAMNVAIDEALLDWAEVQPDHLEILRIWEPTEPLVVVGRSSRLGQEVNLDACRQKGIPVFRRSSGGAAIVAGPGCLMYAVILSTRHRPDLAAIDKAHQFVLGRMEAALRSVVPDISRAGTSDLILEGEKHLKCSGNSMRAKREHLLYHGTILYDFDLSSIASCLLEPPRQPEYRQRRIHGEFVTNLPANSKELISAIDTEWPTTGPLLDWPIETAEALVESRYSQTSWNEML